MSTSSHQLYLRRVAKETKSVIFSIDYPKAPFSKYFDIFQVIIKFYLFITLLIKSLKIEAKVVFYGDSAGGTLLSALNAWIILNGL